MQEERRVERVLGEDETETVTEERMDYESLDIRTKDEKRVNNSLFKERTVR